MSNPRPSDAATRIALAFALLAVLVALSAWLAWRSHWLAETARDQWTRSKSVESDIERLQSATSKWWVGFPCAVDPAAEEAWRSAAKKLALDAQALQDDTLRAAVDGLQSAGKSLLVGVMEPRAQACGNAVEPADASVQSVARDFNERLSEVQRVALVRSELAASDWQSRMVSLKRWLGWLALASVATAAAALLAARGFMQQLLDVRRKVHDEGREREHAKDELAVTQRRMRVLVDHVKDAVVAFDADGYIQWVNPAGEALFGRERQGLLGESITALMPQLKAELEATALADRATVTDELGLPWFSKTVAIEGFRRAGPSRSLEALALDVSLVQTRVSGHAVGIVVARDLSHVRRMQRDKELVLNVLRRDVVPELRAMQARLEQLEAGASAWGDAAVPTILDDGASDETTTLHRHLAMQSHRESLQDLAGRAQLLGRMVDDALSARR